jgi:hypothetical protein
MSQTEGRKITNLVHDMGKMQPHYERERGSDECELFRLAMREREISTTSCLIYFLPVFIENHNTSTLKPGIQSNGAPPYVNGGIYRRAPQPSAALYTTGAGGFAEGSRLSAKALRPSAKALPRAVLSKAVSAKTRSAKPSLPRAVYRALGKGFAESQRGSRQRKGAVNGPAFFAESPFGWLSAKSFLFVGKTLCREPVWLGSRQTFSFF